MFRLYLRPTFQVSEAALQERQFSFQENDSNLTKRLRRKYFVYEIAPLINMSRDGVGNRDVFQVSTSFQGKQYTVTAIHSGPTAHAKVANRVVRFVQHLAKKTRDTYSLLAPCFSVSNTGVVSSRFNRDP